MISHPRRRPRLSEHWTKPEVQVLVFDKVCEDLPVWLVPDLRPTWLL